MSVELSNPDNPSVDNSNSSAEKRQNAELDGGQDGGYRVSFHLPPLTDGAKMTSQGRNQNGAAPVLETKVHVNHEHYEQWARVPTRKPPPPTIIFRSFQHVKSKTEIKEEQRRESDESLIRQSTAPLRSILRDKTIVPKVTRNLNFRREKTNIKSRHHEESTFTKSLASVRSPIKLSNAQITEVDNTDSEQTAGLKDRQNDVTNRDIRPRNGIARIRDRCPLPLSINSPRCIGDHVFLINEPFRYPESAKQSSRQTVRQKDSKPELGPEWSTGEPIFRDNENSVHKDETADPEQTKQFQRSKSYFGSFTPRKLQTYRTPASVPSAELFDFSQLTELSKAQSDVRYLSRQRTDITLRGSRLTHKQFVFNSHETAMGQELKQ